MRSFNPEAILISQDLKALGPEDYFRYGTGRGYSGAPHHVYLRTDGTICWGQPLEHSDYYSRKVEVISIVVCGPLVEQHRDSLYVLHKLVMLMHPGVAIDVRGETADGIEFKEWIYGSDS